MVTMENAEEVMQILERFTRLKQKEIPKELDEYLGYVAKTGDTVFKWSSLKYLFREKLLNVIKQFHDTTPRIDEIPQYPNVDPFNYESMKSTLLERLELFNAAPFTVQRLCELLIDPRKQYSRIDKFMRALEKNILVVSTVEPGRKRTESENGDSLDSVVNGDILLDVNVDIDMEADSLLNMEAQAQNNTQNVVNDTTTTTTLTTGAVNEDNDNNTSSASLQDDMSNGSDKEANASNNKESSLIKTVATHIADDDILPHPKKVKLDITDKAQNEEHEHDDDEDVGGKNDHHEIKSESYNHEDSTVKKNHEKIKGINEECAHKISDEQAQNDNLENREQQQQHSQQVEAQKTDQEKSHNLKEAKQALDERNVKANADSSDGVVHIVPVIATAIESNEKDKSAAATATIVIKTVTTREDNEKNETGSVNDTEQNINVNQDSIHEESTVYVEQLINADKINKIQTIKENEQHQEKEEQDAEIEQKEEGKKQADENLVRQKISDSNEIKTLLTGQQQQIATIVKNVVEESAEFETIVEKQELEKCEKDQCNINVTEDKNEEKRVRETLEKLEAKIGVLENVEERHKSVQEGQTERGGEEEAEDKRVVAGQERKQQREEELLELQLLSNKTEELVEVIENNKMETIHEDLEEDEEVEKKVEVENAGSKEVTSDKKTDNSVINNDVTITIVPKEVDKDFNLEQCSKEEGKSEEESLVDTVEKVQQNRSVENAESENKNQTNKVKEGNEETEIHIEAIQSTTKTPIAITANELEILNEIALQTSTTACSLNNEAKICETLGMATEIAAPEGFPQQQTIGSGLVVTAIATDTASSISSDSIIILPTTITPTATPTSVLTNISMQGEQPMIEDVTIEEEAPPTVEEVVMAEPPLPPSQQLSLSSSQLIAPITSITSVSAIMDVEPSIMEIDDTSQEAMDQ